MLTRQTLIHQGHVVQFFVEWVTLPNGRTVDLDVIRHPGASAVVPILPDGQVVLVYQYRHAAGGYLYEIPAGKLDAGESPEQCAIREVEEETGYRIGLLRKLTTIYTAPGFCDEQIHLYLGTELTAGEAHKDEDEVLQVVQMPLAEALQKIADQTICDAKSIAALHLAARYLREAL
jgi:ADP-ribose pyrophosphatase